MSRAGKLAAASAVALIAFTNGVANAAAVPQPYRTNDYGGFNAILPPGTNGLANPFQLANFEATGARPPHNDDQYAAYANLVYAPLGLTAAQIPNYFHDASFGTPPGQVERTYSPRGDVTIQRDHLGVPHVYGDTRAGAMFGLGYAAAEDRLFFMDALRHAGRAELSSFAGGAPANRQMDEEVWADTPYTEQDLQRQCDYRPKGFETQADQLHQDVTDYIAGINQYISEARLDPTKMPGEYAAIGKPLGPTDWTCPDVVATASLIGGIFGKGGGRELDSALTLEQAQKQFGGKGGKRVWSDFRNANDAGAPTTVHHKRFPYEVPPRKHAKGRALPDPGTVQNSEVVSQSSASPAAPGANPVGGLLGPLGGLLEGGPLRSAASNALLVSARDSEGAHPVAVMGPQVAYFAPQILMEEDVHAPTLDARGAAFPGVNSSSSSAAAATTPGAIIESRPIDDPQVRDAVAVLSDWVKSGAHRVDRNHDGHYDSADAIRIKDAWWPGLIHAEFEPTLGKDLFDKIAGMTVLDDSPHLHLGSAYDGGWYVYANKDLRTMLAKGHPRRMKRIRDRNSRIYCGGGKLGQCRDALISSLKSALGTDPYPASQSTCHFGDKQMCFDAIEFRPTGGVTQPDMVWMNRPTFQQADQIQGHR